MMTQILISRYGSLINMPRVLKIVAIIIVILGIANLEIDFTLRPAINFMKKVSSKK